MNEYEDEELPISKFLLPSHDGLRCEFCGDPDCELYEGWFKAVETNWFNKGTATDGLIQNRIACKTCSIERGKSFDEVV